MNDPRKANVWTFDEDDEDPFHVLARGFEADVNGLGWDCPPRLGVVVGHHLGDDSFAYEVVEIPMFPEFYESAPDALQLWATKLLVDPYAIRHLYQLLKSMKGGFLGMVLVAESWYQEGEGRGDPKEGRVCILVLSGGRMVQVFRRRDMDGGLDKLDLLGSLEGTGGIGGFITWNLAALVGIAQAVVLMTEGDIRSLDAELTDRGK